MAAGLLLAGLALTHNITLLLVTPVLAIYMFVYWRTGPRHGDFMQPIWGGAALLTAMGISAFFWLPVIVERRYLATTAYEIAAAFLRDNVWTWSNFLDLNLPFEYTLNIPFQVGVLQVALAALGFLLVKPRSAEWWFWAMVALVAGLAIGSWTLPFWLSHDILKSIQFTWRLLTIVSLALALLATGIIARLPSPLWNAVGTAMLLAVVVLGHRLPADLLTPDPVNRLTLGASSLAPFEAQNGLLGTSSTYEFMPRWVEEINPEARPNLPETDIDLAIDLLAADPFEIQAQVDAPAPVTLHLGSFYFPGWQAMLDGLSPLDVYPSSDKGLLAVDLPAGQHRLTVAWRGTQLQQWAAWLSLGVLLALALFFASRRQYVLAIVPVFLAAGALLATSGRLPSRSADFLQAQAEIQHGLELLGVRTRQAADDALLIYPYWRTHATPPDLRVRWQLIDSTGEIVSEVNARPVYSVARAHTWAPGILVDDAYQMKLPPGLASGKFDLRFALSLMAEDASDRSQSRFEPVGSIPVNAVPTLAVADASSMDIRFGDEIVLDRYDVAIYSDAQADDHLPLSSPIVVRPGDLVVYALYWRAMQSVSENYHGFVHLLDA
ncbi:MAG: hypothetical protein HC802_12290, partial [Caldilineaceae bacterium]|nr:hypothetical protein [Caldilineaceae bacterium]